MKVVRGWSEIEFDQITYRDYGSRRESKSEPAAIEGAAAEQRGSRVLIVTSFTKPHC